MTPPPTSPVTIPRIISVDDHVVEPPDIFEGRFAAKFADEAPRVVDTENGGQAWLWTGQLLPNVGFNAVAGYTTGLVMEKTLAVATSLDQLELRRANFSLSNELKTLDGTYALDAMGGQIGELTPLGQLELDDKDPEKVKFISIYPHETATGKPVYPRP